MKYDDASWHSDGDFPADLPPEAGATHIGMYLAWLLLRGMASEELLDDMQDELEALTERTMTPGQFLLVCDGKLVDDMISDEANAFTAEYYDMENGQYLDDYEDLLGEHVPDLYHVADTWENFDRLAPVIAQRFAAWQTTQA
ncbi:hypothetical protein C1924_19285 [Stenotrophomonas sp. ESTM1D_MKCIP4_1]|uniref:DUF7832 domain-containing protein n=1 Tax=Stenotrophomonas sp. ESTM1D_MKCIP4_1 TaxID=2072414 RepID=UPI000D53D9E9|nr:hypothetical protein [Stenotrophomonas sp. ESTM1D_MKCIP4_1]AWH55179.1 hypothetical protein C1924_19285 [Stenotrophomonas sp. ESTM1D_MKCIP4_1]